MSEPDSAQRIEERLAEAGAPMVKALETSRGASGAGGAGETSMIRPSHGWTWRWLPVTTLRAGGLDEAEHLKRAGLALDRLLSLDFLRRCHEIASACDMDEAIVREMARELLLAGPKDPLLGIDISAFAGREPNGDEWVMRFVMALYQREAPAATWDVWGARRNIDNLGQCRDEDVALDLIVPAHRVSALTALNAAAARLSDKAYLKLFFRVPLLRETDTALDLFCANAGFFRRHGLYEDALMTAYLRGPDIRPLETLRWLFDTADRAKLYALYPLPGPGPFTVFRGVGGRRRTRGMSWASSLDAAALYAACAQRRMYLEPENQDPMIYTTSLEPGDIYGYFRPSTFITGFEDVDYDEILAIVDLARITEVPGAREKIAASCQRLNEQGAAAGLAPRPFGPPLNE